LRERFEEVADAQPLFRQVKVDGGRGYILDV
jgi:hypothetical protein